VAWALVLGYLAVTQAVYLATPLELEWLLATTLDRIIGVMVPAAVFLCVREVSSIKATHNDRQGEPRAS
jgi:hypothetical protein